MYRNRKYATLGRTLSRNMQFGRAPRGNHQRPWAKNASNVFRAEGRLPGVWPSYSQADEYQSACFKMEMAGK